MKPSEWNTIIRTATARLKENDCDMDEYFMEEAITGRAVTANQYNQVLRAINVFNPHNMQTAVRGEAITADMLNMLASKLNLE